MIRQILKKIFMCGEAAQMGGTLEFVSSNVTYTPTVNKTGVLQKKPKVLL